MKRLITFILIIISAAGISQPKKGECLMAEKNGLIFKVKVLIFFQDSINYFSESYVYGGGIFNGLPMTDSLILNNNKLVSETVTIEFINEKKARFLFEKHSKKYKFKKYNECDPEINRIRNLSYREYEKYRLTNPDSKATFTKQTDPLIEKYCYNQFIVKVNEIKESIENKSDQ